MPRTTGDRAANASACVHLVTATSFQVLVVAVVVVVVVVVMVVWCNGGSGGGGVVWWGWGVGGGFARVKIEMTCFVLIHIPI